VVVALPSPVRPLRLSRLVCTYGMTRRAILHTMDILDVHSHLRRDETGLDEVGACHFTRHYRTSLCGSLSLSLSLSSSAMQKYGCAHADSDTGRVSAAFLKGWRAVMIALCNPRPSSAVSQARGSQPRHGAWSRASPFVSLPCPSLPPIRCSL
jgi:hypothetical protein